jgi:ABC-type polysaccharide/polyol phosphate export permease
MAVPLELPLGGLDSSRAPRRSLELVRISAIRNLKNRYRGTTLGVLWSFANPVLLTALYTAIFGTAFRAYYEDSVTRYVLSAFVGVTVVLFFIQATSEAMPAVVANGSLLNKIPVAPEVFPVSAVAANAFQQGITTFPVILIVSALVTHDPVRVVLCVLVLAALIVLSLGVGLILAALYVFFRDLGYLWGVVGFILWMTSPVFYPAELVPPNVRPWLVYNPVGQMVTALREVTIAHGPLRMDRVLPSFLTALVLLAAGVLIFRATRREYMDLL